MSDRRGATLTRIWAAGAAIFAVAVAVTALGVWYLSSDARQEIDALATANADSTQWSLAQAEVELLTFNNALLAAVVDQGDPDLAEVRNRFDVFYSRMNTLRSSPVFAEMRAIPEVKIALGAVDGFLQSAVPLIDGADTDLVAELAPLASKAQDLRSELRTISLAGVRVFAARSEDQRSRVASALFDLATLVFVLFVGLLAFVLALVWSVAIGRKRNTEIRLAQDRLRAVIRTSPNAVLVVARDGRVLDFNGAAERIFGYAPEEAIGQQMADLIVPDHLRAAHDVGMKRHLATGEKRVVDKGIVQLEAKHKSGQVFPVELTISTVESEDGEVFVSFIRDISKRVTAETELVAARDKALAGEKAKAELLAVMSHEMRTPLNGIIGSLELLADTELNPRQRKFVDVMATSGRMLLGHVNTVLDISRADAGQIEMTRKAFDPESLAETLVESLAFQAQKRGNTLGIRIVGQGIGQSVGDAARLRQVLVNLLGNAIKFTHDGQIMLELERLAGGDDVEFRVTDTGVGIPEADLDRIFHDFVTLDPSYTREVEGTGLGLGIAKRMVTVMGGEIGVESEPGEGTVFWVRLPLPRTSADEAPSLPRSVQARNEAPQVEGLSVLIVEDNEVNRLVLREMLDSLGCRITEARDGQEGVARAGEARFDLILMDISMPRLDGIGATRMIRDGDGPNAGTPIVALTAHALPDDIKRFQEAGMADVVIKPISKDRLARALAECARTTSTAQRDSLDKAQRAPARNAAMDELIATLGAERAETLLKAAAAELTEGLAVLSQTQDVATLGAHAHKLAGTAALVGLAELRGHLVAIEAACNSDARDAAGTAMQAAALEIERLKAGAYPGFVGTETPAGSAGG